MTTVELPPTAFRVLHALRCRGVASAEAVARGADLSIAEVLTTLAAMEPERLVKLWSGKLPGWGLTDSGRRLGARLVSSALDAAGARDAVEAQYQRFLPLNHRFLTLCQDWQVVIVDGTPTPNTHLDDAYDRGVITRLASLDSAAQDVVAQLASTVDWYGHYGERFRNALANVESGGQDWFTRPGIDSYHTVWFELHEDLLATLGHKRASER